MISSLTVLHPILTVLAFGIYAGLYIRFVRKPDPRLSALEITLAHLARFSLLGLYLTGLLLSMNFHKPVHEWHHYASLIPVGVLFIFQFLPGMKNQNPTIKQVKWMFLFLALSMILISMTALMKT